MTEAPYRRYRIGMAKATAMGLSEQLGGLRDDWDRGNKRERKIYDVLNRVNAAIEQAVRDLETAELLARPKEEG